MEETGHGIMLLVRIGTLREDIKEIKLYTSYYIKKDIIKFLKSYCLPVTSYEVNPYFAAINCLRVLFASLSSINSFVLIATTLRIFITLVGSK